MIVTDMFLILKSKISNRASKLANFVARISNFVARCGMSVLTSQIWSGQLLDQVQARGGYFWGLTASFTAFRCDTEKSAFEPLKFCVFPCQSSNLISRHEFLIMRHAQNPDFNARSCRDAFLDELWLCDDCTGTTGIQLNISQHSRPTSNRVDSFDSAWCASFACRASKRDYSIFRQERGDPLLDQQVFFSGLHGNMVIWEPRQSSTYFFFFRISKK